VGTDGWIWMGKNLFLVESMHLLGKKKNTASFIVSVIDDDDDDVYKNMVNLIM